MTRLRYPRLMLCIFVGWLVVAERITSGQVMLAAVVALGGAWMFSRLQLPAVVPGRPRVMLRLLLSVAIDIMRSNVAVARIILTRAPVRHSNFLDIPLELRDRAGLAVLACIITATPGTIWVRYDRVSGHLLLHILDLVDEEEWTRTIKNRYERRLMEIFE